MLQCTIYRNDSCIVSSFSKRFPINTLPTDRFFGKWGKVDLVDKVGGGENVGGDSLAIEEVYAKVHDFNIVAKSGRWPPGYVYLVCKIPMGNNVDG